MKIVKQCAYCGRVYNLLPAVMVTPLYIANVFDNPAPIQDCSVTGEVERHHRLDGFRLALKFWKWHLGWEIHYE